MNRTPNDRSRYDGLRRAGARWASWLRLVQVGFLALGFGIFLDQSRSLLSDAQFTWGERQVMGIVALLALGGCGFAGWVVGRSDQGCGRAVGCAGRRRRGHWRTNELIERHVVPALGRIASASGTDRNVGEIESTHGREHP